MKFENDIKIGDWKVSRIIRIGGPRTSTYKYDFRNFFEFAITDINGVCKVLTWYHNAGDKVLKSYWGDSAVDALPFFFTNHPIFSAENWEDYQCVLTLNGVIDIIEKPGVSAKEKIDSMAALLRSV